MESKHILTQMAVVSMIVLMAVSMTYAESPKDAGIVMQLIGKAAFTNNADTQKSGQVQTFMKIRGKDRIDLSADSRINILFTGNGRRETWEGPIQLDIGENESQPVGKAAKPQVEQMASSVSDVINTSALPLPRGQIMQAGVTHVRADSESASLLLPLKALNQKDKEEIESARKTYAEMKKQAKLDDFIPELYLLSLLAKHEQFGEMEMMTDNLIKSAPQHPVFNEWKKWISENYPIRPSVFVLVPDKNCKKGMSKCVSLKGSIGSFKENGPLSLSETENFIVKTDNILAFTIANTSDIDFYCYILSISSDGKPEIIFPASGSKPETASIHSKQVFDLFDKLGIGLFFEKSGNEIVQFLIASNPINDPVQVSQMSVKPEGIKLLQIKIKVEPGL